MELLVDQLVSQAPAVEEDIQQGFHVIDRDAAQLFFEVMQYYRAFEQEFNRQTQFMMRQLRMTGKSD